MDLQQVLNVISFYPLYFVNRVLEEANLSQLHLRKPPIQTIENNRKQRADEKEPQHRSVHGSLREETLGSDKAPEYSVGCVSRGEGTGELCV